MIPGEISPAKGDIELNAGRHNRHAHWANTGAGEVTLVPHDGERRVFGFRQTVMGGLDPA